jgi:hypothetical protein
MPIMLRRLVSVAAVFAVLCPLAGSARADVFNALGRYLGVGWSDGYHAQDACCPGPVWAMRKGNSPPRHMHYSPIVPYYETFSSPVYPAMPYSSIPTPAIVPRSAR